MALFRELDKCVLKHEDSQFLPLSEISTIVTENNIKSEIPIRKRCLSNRNLPRRILSEARKIFSILVLIEETWAIVDLVRRDDISDQDLPLVRKSVDGDDANVLLSASSGKVFPSFSSWPKKARVREFLHFQWLVQAPVLSFFGQHILLDSECPLPLVDWVMKCKSGPNSVIHKCKIHRAHHTIFKHDPEPFVAVKEVYSDEAFEEEKKNLEVIQCLQHEHLIKLIATCQKGSTCYFIFPWADGGDLLDFWESNDPRQCSKELILWSLHQMLGIVSAIKALHERNIRHGDIKPQNILHFLKKDKRDTMDERGRLILADVGVSKKHREVTSMRHDPTNCQQSTVTYEAPEAQTDQREGKPRGRRYDMWSLGCMFLEFTVWLVFDYGTVRRFRKSRRSRDDPKDAFGSFFIQTSDGSIQIHPAVHEAIGHLRNHPLCSDNSALTDLIKLIEDHLLQVDVQKRAEAADLYKRLERVVCKAKLNLRY